MKFNFKNVKIDTWARLLFIIVAMVAAIVEMNKTGVSFSSAATSALAVISTLWGYWKNNSFTELAQQADEILESDEVGSGYEVTERLIYPLKNMRITQGYNGSTSHYKHSHSADGIIDYSLDDGEIDGGNNDYFYAPCTLRITNTYTTGTNSFWWESVDEVLLANGKKAKVCGHVVHCPDSSFRNLRIGQIFKQGERVAQEGKDGATGYHFHHAVGLGRCKKLSGCSNPWKKNRAGAYVLTQTGDAIKPEHAYFVNTKFTKIINGGNLNWVKTDSNTVSDGKYFTGKYTVTADKLNVRAGTGTNFAKKKFGELTPNAQAQVLTFNKNVQCDGLVKGCTCNVSAVTGNWGKIPSGWICLDYCKKI